MAMATMTSKGQITIPKEVRDAAGLRPGVRVEFTREPDGRILLRPLTRSLDDLFGMVKYDGPPVTIEEMNEAVGRAVSAKYLRSLRRWRGRK